MINSLKKPFVYFTSSNFRTTQIDKIAHKLKCFSEQLKNPEGATPSLYKRCMHPTTRTRKAHFSVKKGSQEEKKIRKLYGISKKVLLDYEKNIKSARKIIKQIEVESTVNATLINKDCQIYWSV